MESNSTLFVVWSPSLSLILLPCGQKTESFWFHLSKSIGACLCPSTGLSQTRPWKSVWSVVVVWVLDQGVDSVFCVLADCVRIHIHTVCLCMCVHVSVFSHMHMYGCAVFLMNCHGHYECSLCLAVLRLTHVATPAFLASRARCLFPTCDWSVRVSAGGLPLTGSSASVLCSVPSLPA